MYVCVCVCVCVSFIVYINGVCVKMYVCVYECKGCRIVKYANTPQTRCRIITRCRILLHKHGAGLSQDYHFILTDLVVIIHVYAYPIFERTCVLIYLPLLPSPSYLVNIHSIHTVPLQSMMFHPYNQHR